MQFLTELASAMQLQLLYMNRSLRLFILRGVGGGGGTRVV